MELVLDFDKLEVIKEESYYNNTYYRYGKKGLKLYQKCDEEYNTYDYYLIEGESKVFLGSADSDPSIIDFMIMYT